MNKILLTLLFIIGTISLNAQTSDGPFGGFVGEINTIIGNDTLIISNIFDQSSVRLGTAIDTSYVIWASCRRFEITEVINAVSNQALLVVDNSSNFNFNPNTIVAIIEESPQGIGHFISGISTGLQQCIGSYYASLIGTGNGGGGSGNVTCNTDVFTSPFTFNDKVVLNNVSADSSILDVYINGVFLNPNSYTLSDDTLVLTTYIIQNTDELYVRGCRSSLTPSNNTLNNVLSANNDAGGLTIGGLADPTSGQDAVTRSYLENNSIWLSPQLNAGAVNINASNNPLIFNDLGIFRMENVDGLNVDYEVIFSPNTSIPLRLGRYEGGDTIKIDMQGGALSLRDTSGSYILTDLANKNILELPLVDDTTSFTTNQVVNIGNYNLADVRVNPVTFTVPPGIMTKGASATIVDSYGNADVNNITIDFITNNYNKHGVSENFIIDVAEGVVKITYINEVVGFIIETK